MRALFYQRLAVSGIRKNKKTYLPYILTCIGMVMMYYIISFLAYGEAVASMRGGDDMQMILRLGCGVMGIFSVIFLFYTNSFLVRRRKKEFGLYNILGMGKRHLFQVMFWETLIVAAIALGGGLLCGILFSKLAELCMAKVLGTEGSLLFSVEWSAVSGTVMLFAVIFFLILVNGIRQIHLARPLELLGSETVGEKPPKVRWLSTVIGLGLLIGAYYIAVTIENPMAVVMLFFVAVIMVIIATYLLFVSGSVALCRILQRKKNYYYKTNHFVSVSSMAYRMKRNGAGLASICILSTMVLVMISSTACLFIGTESTLRNRYPRNIILETYSLDEAYVVPVKEVAREAAARHGLTMENELQYRFLNVAGYRQEDEIIFDRDKVTNFGIDTYSNVVQLFCIPLSDYNRLMGTGETLEKDQVLLYCTKMNYEYDTFTIEGMEPLRVKAVVPEFVANGDDTMQMMPSIFVFVPDITKMEEIFEVQAEIYGDNLSFQHDYYGFDLDCDDEEMLAVHQEISDGISKLQLENSEFPTVRNEVVAESRDNYYALYGGMFFLGVLLGLVFILAAVLMIYYKQVSEGYEDQARFLIMQKVGMTKKEIRRSINSQILTVFFLPLLAAGVHMVFAFPMILRTLMMFGMFDVPLFIGVVIGCYLLFGVFYVAVYRGTSKAYFGIVSGRR